MKKLFLTLSLALTCAVMFAVPAKRGQWKTVKLANGQEVRVELRGDEFCHYWQTADGLKLVPNKKTGLFEKADMNRMTKRAAELRAKAHAPKLNRPATRVTLGGEHPVYEGERKALIILVQFADLKFKPEHTADLYRRIANEEGFSEGKFRGSVRDYFHDQSFGKFTLNFDVAGPVTLPEGYAYYGENIDGDHSNPEKMGEFTRTACQLADDEVDFSQYDWDGDGEVEQVFFVFAGHGEASYGEDPNTIWPHKFNIRFCPPYTTLTLDGTVIDTYACSNELGSGDEIDGIGAICHEFSHCFGLADMYDTSYNGNFGLDKWGVMDQGNYNGDSFVPAGYTSYERWYIGWTEPTELTGNMQVNNMKALSTSGESYIIYNEGYDNEYYMLENRVRTGWDSELPGSGLLILHIDFDPTIWASNMVNSMAEEHCTIFHADNSAGTSATDLAGDTYPYAYNNSLSNTSTPAATLHNVNSDGSLNMNKAVTNITKNADGTISFAFEDLTSAAEDYNLPESYIFYESFDQCNGQGGNDNRFSGTSVGKGTMTTDNSGWTSVGGKGADQCAMVGSTTLPGQITTPEITLNGEAELWFKVAPYTNDGTQLTLDVREGDAELSKSEFTMMQGRWSAFSTKVNGTGNVKIRFKTNKGRFFLDKVCLTNEDVTGISNVTVNGNDANDGRIYSLDGRYMGKDLDGLQKGVYIVNGKKIIK